MIKSYTVSSGNSNLASVLIPALANDFGVTASGTYQAFVIEDWNGKSFSGSLYFASSNMDGKVYICDDVDKEFIILVSDAGTTSFTNYGIMSLLFTDQTTKQFNTVAPTGSGNPMWWNAFNCGKGLVDMNANVPDDIVPCIYYPDGVSAPIITPFYVSQKCRFNSHGIRYMDTSGKVYEAIALNFYRRIGN